MDIERAITADIQQIADGDRFSWAKRTVQIRNGSSNPFLAKDVQVWQVNSVPAEHPVSRLFYKSGFEMEISFPEEVHVRTVDHDRHVLERNRRSTAYVPDLNSSFNVAPESLSFIRGMSFPMVVSQFRTDFGWIEPIHCTAFLYSATERSVISEPWHFIPKNSAPFFAKGKIAFTPNLVGEFQVDQAYVNDRTYIVVVLSHPMTGDEGPVRKYYKSAGTNNHGNSSLEKNAVAKIAHVFPAVNAMTTFAFTYVELLKQTEWKFPPPILTKRAVTEKTLPELIDGISTKKVKQIPIHIVMSKYKGEDVDVIMRSGWVREVRPIMIPIHQLVLSLKSLEVKTSGFKCHNLMVEVGVKDGKNVKKYVCVHSKTAMESLVSADCGSCYAHERVIGFDDMFILELPLEVRTTVISFTLIHVCVRQKQVETSTVGEAVLPLCDDNGVVAGNGQTVVHFGHLEKKKAAVNGSLTVTTMLRSNFATNDVKYQTFLECGETCKELVDTLKQVPDSLIVEHLMIVLDRIMQVLEVCSDMTFEPFLVVREAFLRSRADSGEQSASRGRFENSMIAYVRYFAFKHLRGNVRGTGATTDGSSDTLSMDGDILSCGSPGHDTADLIDFGSETVRVVTCVPMYLKLIDCFVSTIHETGFSTLNSLIYFLLVLIIKAIEVAETRDLGHKIEEFITAFVSAMPEDRANSRAHAKAIGKFMALLFDIDRYLCSAQGTKICLDFLLSTSESHDMLMSYMECAFRPNAFLQLIRHVDCFRESVVKTIKTAIESPHHSVIEGVFRLLIDTFNCYDDDMCGDIASALIEYVCDVEPTVFIPSTYNDVRIRFLVFLLRFADAKSIRRLEGLGKAHILIRLCHILLVQVRRFDKSRKKREGLNACTPQKTPGRKVTCIESPRKLMQPKARKRLHRPERRGSNEEASRMSARLSAIAKPNENRFVSDTHEAIIRFSTEFADICNAGDAERVMRLYYHFMSVEDVVGGDDGSVSINDSIFSGCLHNVVAYAYVVKRIFERFPTIVHMRLPCWVQLINRMLSIDVGDSTSGDLLDSIKKLFTAMFDGDLATNGNNHRMTVLFARSLSMLSEERLKNPTLMSILCCFENAPNAGLRGVYTTFMKLRSVSIRLENGDMPYATRLDCLLERVIALDATPDGRVDALSKLTLLHKTMNNTRDMVYVKLLQAVIIRRCCMINWPVPKELEKCIQPLLRLIPESLAFPDVLSSEFVEAVRQLPGWGDSSLFNELSFIAIAYEIIDICIAPSNTIANGSLIEVAIAMIDAVWPILEHRRLYVQISELFARSEKAFEVYKSLPPHNADSMAEKYFMVSLTGSVFGNENGCSYVYCEKRLLHVIDFTRQIERSYEKQVVGDKLRRIGADESAGPEEAGVGYIRIVTVVPHREERLIAASLGTTRRSSCFRYDMPFVPGKSGDELQGSVDEQWLRRTVITTAISIPSIVTRAKVTDTKVKEVPPIRVACRMIRDQTEKCRRALHVRSFPDIEPLVTGSLLVQVNEGPSRMIELFLINGPAGPDKEKLRVAFDELGAVLAELVKAHNEIVTMNPAKVPVQVQLEDRMAHFLDALADAKNN